MPVKAYVGFYNEHKKPVDILFSFLFLTIILSNVSKYGFSCKGLSYSVGWLSNLIFFCIEIDFEEFCRRQT